MTPLSSRVGRIKQKPTDLRRREASGTLTHAQVQKILGRKTTSLVEQATSKGRTLYNVVIGKTPRTLVVPHDAD